MARFKRIFEGKDGWSEWQAPNLHGYRMACCDCNLVHDMQFKFIRVTKRQGKRWWGKRATGIKVLFRARRNSRSTTMLRNAEAKQKGKHK